jgi:hypothetical protein
MSWEFVGDPVAAAIEVTETPVRPGRAAAYAERWVSSAGTAEVLPHSFGRTHDPHPRLPIWHNTWGADGEHSAITAC